jgi:acyl dehydratase
VTNAEGPYFDELNIGQVFASAPAMTLSAGRAAVRQSIIGSRLRLSLDEELSRQVAGAALADPSFVWDVAIGQSTLATRRVVANLFYRGFSFHRLPALGDTLHTRTEVVGLKQNSSKPSGLAALRVTTCDQEDRLVLDFWRCAMLPLSSPDVDTGHADDLTSVGQSSDPALLGAIVDGWETRLLPKPATGTVGVGHRWSLRAGDVVSSAPELARMTLNLAHVHHDAFSQPTGRLVPGGHTIGLALAQLTRTLPDLVSVAAWHSCDHTGPVREGDTLVSDISIEDERAVTNDIRALTLSIQMYVRRADETGQVLDWKLVALSR